MILKTLPNASEEPECRAQSVCRLRPGLFCWLTLMVFFSARCLAAESLPGTEPLDWTDDMSVRIIEEAHHWLDRKLDESIAERELLWNRDFSSREAYERSVEPNREHLRKCIGVVDSRLPIVMERYGDDFNPALVAEAATKSTASARSSFWKGASTGLHRPSAKENRLTSLLDEQGTTLKLE